MITLSHDGTDVTLRNPAPSNDSREYDQSMIVRRSRRGRLITFRNANWHDFDTVRITSKNNTKDNAFDARDLIQDSWGEIIQVDVDYSSTGSDGIAGCTDFKKRFTGIVITKVNEVVTVKDEIKDNYDMTEEYGAYDVEFDLLVETEVDLP